MRLELRTSWILLTLMGLFPVLNLAGADCRESEDVEIAVTVGFASKAEALEGVLGPDSPWVYPYGAPRPADQSDQDMKTTLSLRRLVLNGNQEELGILADQVERRQEAIAVQMRFWLAFAQSELQLNEACWANLRKILDSEEGWESLETGQQVWVLTTTADLLFLLGHRTPAAECYARLAASPVAQLNLWGQYQLAGMDFLGRNFEKAARQYQVVCDAERPGTWREHACAMAEIAGRLGKLEKGGNAHGDLATAHH